MGMTSRRGATTAAGGISRTSISFGHIPFTHRGGEYGQFFLKLQGATMRTRGALPVRRANQDFAILPAPITMKFVDWHGVKIIDLRRSSSASFSAVLILAPGPPKGGTPNPGKRRPTRFGVPASAGSCGDHEQNENCNKFSSHYLKCVSFEIFRFRNGGDNRMIGRLTVNGDPAQ
jgi:hypothetical protein